MVTFKVSDLTKMNEMLASFCEELRERNVCDDTVFESRLVSCELLSNVLRHGGIEAEFNCKLVGNRIEITVASAQFGAINPNPKLPDVFAESGRGLYIVRTLCKGDISINGGEIKVVLQNK